MLKNAAPIHEKRVDWSKIKTGAGKMTKTVGCREQDGRPAAGRRKDVMGGLVSEGK